MSPPAPRSYPPDLAAGVRARWPEAAVPLPARFEDILDTAYHASFLRDEERPVACRILALAPGELPDDVTPPAGLMPLAFEAPRGFDEHELRRLSPAAKYHRSLIGVTEAGGELVTWGLVQSGPRWLQASNGGRLAEPLMPPCLVVRVVATMRAARHGGVLVIVPPACRAERHLTIKYALREGPARRSFRRLMLAILDELDRRAAVTGGAPGPDLYRAEAGRTLAELDEALFELSHLIASLADVDGAVVLTKRFEVLGFGAEISGDLPDAAEVRRALDSEADASVAERTDGVGTRHRSAYRLCAAVPQALAIVVSQDGGARFVANRGGAVTYWDHDAGDE